MTNLLLMFAAALLLAYCSEHRIMVIGRSNGKCIDLPVIIMIVMLSLFCGLRTAFNDTGTYISSFQNAPTLTEFWSQERSIFGNPLFYWLQCFFRHHISANYHLFFLVNAFFNISCFLSFFRKYSENFVFSVLMFFTLGLYVFNFAAMKQCAAMAVLTLAIPKLLDKRYISYYLLVLIAVLLHAYAIMFVILPLFSGRPWSLMSYIALFCVVFALATFETTITSFLEYAEELGKSISEDAVFETQSINLFRLAVYSVPPLFLFFFQSRLRPQFNRNVNILSNMSILSFLIMCLGLASGANLFGRSAIYFEIGTIVILPWIIQKLFTRKSAQFVFFIAAACYIAFFLYDVQNWGSNYSGISFRDFIGSLLG